MTLENVIKHQEKCKYLRWLAKLNEKFKLTYGEISNFNLKYNFIVYSVKKVNTVGDGIGAYE